MLADQAIPPIVDLSAGLRMRSPETRHMWRVCRWRMRQRRGRACAPPGRAACGPADHPRLSSERSP